MGLKSQAIAGAIIIAIIAIVIFAWMGMRTVATGEVGIKTEFNNAKEQVGPGLHIINPFTEAIVVMDVKTQKITEDAAAASKDLQNVATTVAVNYQLDPAKTFHIFQTIGLDYNNRITVPAIQEVVKQVTAQYKAADLINQREQVKVKIQAALEQRLDPLGIDVTAVSITNFDFSPEFDAIIEKTAQAQQNEQLAQNQLRVTMIEAQKKIVEAEAQKNATIAQSEGISEGTIIRATGDAEAIAKIQQALLNSTDYINYLSVLQWNGMLPLFGQGPSNGGMDMIFTPEILNLLNTNATSHSNSTIGDLHIPMPKTVDQGKPCGNGGVIINSKCITK